MGEVWTGCGKISAFIPRALEDGQFHPCGMEGALKTVFLLRNDDETLK